MLGKRQLTCSIHCSVLSVWFLFPCTAILTCQSGVTGSVWSTILCMLQVGCLWNWFCFLFLLSDWCIVLKLINNSFSLSKGNHDCDSVWIFNLNYHRFFWFSFSLLSFNLVWIEKIYRKHLRWRLTTTPNTLKFVKNIALCVVFSTLFSVFGNVFKHSLWCLIYYISTAGPVNNKVCWLELFQNNRITSHCLSSSDLSILWITIVKHI